MDSMRKVHISPRFDARIDAATPDAPFKLGILGGTFDPVHVGHIAVAQAAYDSIRLDGVLFIPTGQPVRKMTSCHASPEDRYAMLMIALLDLPYFDVSRIEIDREGVTFTVDTLLSLDSHYGNRAKLYFIGAEEVVDDLPTWKNPEKIAELVTILAVRRGGKTSFMDDEEGTLRFASHEAAGLVFNISPVAMAPLSISSTEIRERVKQGLSIEGMMPRAAQQYMEEHRLYE